MQHPATQTYDAELHFTRHCNILQRQFIDHHHHHHLCTSKSCSYSMNCQISFRMCASCSWITSFTYEYINTCLYSYSNTYVFTYVCTRVCLYDSTHGGDQILNIWISRSISFPDRSFEWRGLRLHTWKLVWKCEDSHENMFGMYWDYCENLLELFCSRNYLKSDLLRLWTCVYTWGMTTCIHHIHTHKRVHTWHPCTHMLTREWQGIRKRASVESDWPAATL